MKFKVNPTTGAIEEVPSLGESVKKAAGSGLGLLAGAFDKVGDLLSNGHAAIDNGAVTATGTPVNAVAAQTAQLNKMAKLAGTAQEKEKARAEWITRALYLIPRILGKPIFDEKGEPIEFELTIAQVNEFKKDLGTLLPTPEEQVANDMFKRLTEQNTANLTDANLGQIKKTTVDTVMEGLKKAITYAEQAEKDPSDLFKKVTVSSADTTVGGDSSHILATIEGRLNDIFEGVAQAAKESVESETTPSE